MTEKTADPVFKPVVRNHDEIVERIKEMAEHDFFGFQTSDMLVYLPWDKAKPFLRPEAVEGEWRSLYPIFTPPLQAAKDYMPFAWDKANNERGISAFRSLEHMQAWLWLAGYEPKTLKELFEEYEYYGKPQLVFVSALVGFNWRDEDNGHWTNKSTGPGLEAAAIHELANRWISLADIHRKE